jgi:GNAT superfamily N-acetyltransferase
MIDLHAALDLTRTMLAADSACEVGAWASDENTVVEAREVEGRRRFPWRMKPFAMRTMGRGVVISCSSDRIFWAETKLRQQERDELFSFSTLAMIADVVALDQQRLLGPNLGYVCGNDTVRVVNAPPSYTLELFEREQMEEAYRFAGFTHSLSYRLDHPCPDMIAIAAWYNGRVVGMAGVGADSAQLWQIGVDVAPEHQGKGLGKALVSRATTAALERGKVPYYATSITNIRSGNTARSVGYQLAWSEAYARDL